VVVAAAAADGCVGCALRLDGLPACALALLLGGQGGQPGELQAQEAVPHLV
jgi:hypothetical protein